MCFEKSIGIKLSITTVEEEKNVSPILNKAMWLPTGFPFL